MRRRASRLRVGGGVLKQGRRHVQPAAEPKAEWRSSQQKAASSTLSPAASHAALIACGAAKGGEGGVCKLRVCSEGKGL